MFSPVTMKGVAVHTKLTPEHAQALNIKGKFHIEEQYAGEGREATVCSIAAGALGAYQLMTGKEIQDEAMQMFALGYTIRGLDTLLDFKLDEGEILTTIIDTHIENNAAGFGALRDLIMTMKGAINGNDKDD